MLLSHALTLQCPFYRPNLCIGTQCVGWSEDVPTPEHWEVYAGSDDEALFPAPPYKEGDTATVERPGDGVEKLWVFRYDHTNGAAYHEWHHYPEKADEGHCTRLTDQ